MSSSISREGYARVKPSVFTAGERCGWEIMFRTGESGIKEGGGIRILAPRSGPVLWELGKVAAFSDNPRAYLEVVVEKTYPLTYHHSNYPAVDIMLIGTDLMPGEEIVVKFGIIGGYNSGRLIQARAQTHSGKGEFRVFADPVGNGRFSRERFRPGAWRAVRGHLGVAIVPGSQVLNKFVCQISSPFKQLGVTLREHAGRCSRSVSAAGLFRGR